MQNKEYSVLYTHQKTKKRKTWQDGILIFQKSNNKVILYDDQRTLLDSLFISSRQIYCGMDLESDRYLITIEEEKNDTATLTSTSSHQTNPNTRQTVPRNYSLPSVRRKGFQPPKFIATEKRLHPGEDTSIGPPDKRFKPLIQDEGRHSQAKISEQVPNKPGIVTRDQFFSLYSQQRGQCSSIPRASHPISDCTTSSKENSISPGYTLQEKGNSVNEYTINNGFQSKRNPSQILALFSSNNNSNVQQLQQEMSQNNSARNGGLVNDESRSFEKYPVALTTSKTSSVVYGNPSEAKDNTLQETVPSLFNSFASVTKRVDTLFDSKTTKRVDALFESLSENKENSFELETQKHLSTSFGNANENVADALFYDLSEEKENRSKLQTPEVNRFECTTKNTDDLFHGISSQEKEEGLQEAPAPFFNNRTSNRNGLFNKSKSSYSTTPYLLDPSNDNKENLGIFPENSEQGSGLDNKGFQSSMWDGSGIQVPDKNKGCQPSTWDASSIQVPDKNKACQSSMWDRSGFQVPDIDYDTSPDFSDSMSSDFYTCNMIGPSVNTTSRQSEQEKTDLMTSWKGSLTSDTVRRESIVPVTKLLGTSQFMAGSPDSKSVTSHEDRYNLPGLGDKKSRQYFPVSSCGTSQRVPKLKTRKKEPMTSCPSSSHTTNYPDVEVPNAVSSPQMRSTFPSHHNSESSGTQDFSHQRRPEENSSQNNVLSTFSNQNLSTNRHGEKPIENSVFQSKLSNQSRRVGLRKPGRSTFGGFLPGSTITTQTPSPASRSDSSSLIDSNAKFKETMMGELVFPSSKECDDNVKPCRQVTLPVTYTSEQQYRHTMKAALREHLNIILFELAQSYHAGLRKVHISQYSSLEQQDTHHDDERPRCSHGAATLRVVKKDGPNKGRLFYCCPGPSSSKCKLFKWVNECKTQAASTNREQSQARRPTLSTSQEITAYFKSQNVSLYCECHLIIKKKNLYSKKFGQDKYRYSKRHLGDDGDVGKTVMYLELSRREASTAYSKDDIWIVSSSLTFDKHSTFVAKSTYFGPYSSGELEISPISGYSPSKWQSGDTVFALHGYNAGNELMCIDNIDDNVKSTYMPLLPRLLTKSDDGVGSRQHLASTFVPPTRNTSRTLDICADFAFALAEETIMEYHLNMDQAAALYDCANMFANDDTGGGIEINISLIHGVFGAGKSYLLAVMIVYIVKLFNTTEQHPKILVSSTTNVAVDRILLGLLDLGFEEFIRVGSVRKIAKKLLPYSMHGSGSSSEDMKELKAMLKEDLEPSEKMHIKKSIEHQRKGGNKQRLTGVPVVGVTCAACAFPCLEKMKFHVLLLDECSQMTEPAALLPLARFGCHKLVLVGDPKQLSPTIQGSQPDHDAGLEQTMFDRLVKMGHKTTMLRTQYRCHPVISAVANRLFYGGRLKNGVSEEDRAPIVEFAPTLCFYDVTKGKEKCGQDGSYYNEEEAKFIVFLIGCFLKSGLEPAQIGVITLYKSQLRTISSYLTQSQTASFKQLKSVQISTVDAFQGGEKDVILLSCVRTDHVGFIDCDRRTNVALTRAKRHLLIVGNQRMLSSNKMWSKVIQHCKGQDGGVVAANDFQQSWQDGNHGNKVKLCNQAKPLTSQETCQSRKEECETVNQAAFEDSDPILVVDYTEISDSPYDGGYENMLDGNDSLIISDDEDFNVSKPSRYNQENKSNDDDDTEVDDVIMTDVLLDDGLSQDKDLDASKPPTSNEYDKIHDDSDELIEVLSSKGSQELGLDGEFINLIKSSESECAGISGKLSDKELSHDTELIDLKLLKDKKENNQIMENGSRLVGVLSNEQLSLDDQSKDMKKGSNNNGDLDEMINSTMADTLSNQDQQFGQGRAFIDPTFNDNNKNCYDEQCKSSETATFSEKENLSDSDKSMTKPSYTITQLGNGTSASRDLQQSDSQAEETSLCSEEFSHQTVKPGPIITSGATWDYSCPGTDTNTDCPGTDTNTDCPGTGTNTEESANKVFPIMDNFDSDEDNLPFFDIFSSMN